MISICIKPTYKHVILFFYFVFFILIQLSARYNARYVRSGIELVAEYGYPLAFIEANGWEWNPDNVFDYQQSSLTAKIFTSVKPMYLGSGRIVNPKRTGYFIWEHNNYNRVLDLINHRHSNKAYFSDRIIEILVFHLPVAKTGCKTFYLDKNEWQSERIYIPWRCLTFNICFFLITFVGISQFFAFTQQKSKRVCIAVISFMIAIPSLSLLVSIYDNIFTEYSSFAVNWFYRLLFTVNVLFFLIAMAGFFIRVNFWLRSKTC